MTYAKQVKVVVYVPVKNAEELREAIHKAGGGTIGNYTNCSWSVVGWGRFTPGQDSNPTIGEPGKPEMVEEERIEFLCTKDRLADVITALKAAHPYEEAAYDVYERLEA